MYKHIRAENLSKNYRIDLAGIQFYTASKKDCLGGSLVIAKALEPGKTQNADVPDKSCELSYTIVTFNWTYLPTKKGGTHQDKPDPNRGGDEYIYYWTDPSNLDKDVFGPDAISAPTTGSEESEADKCKSLYAWVDLMPGPDKVPTLHVTAIVNAPSPCHMPYGEYVGDDKTAPPIYRVKLGFKTDSEICPQVETYRELRYEQLNYSGNHNSVRLIFRDGSSKVVNLDSTRAKPNKS